MCLLELTADAAFLTVSALVSATKRLEGLWRH
jgi:hypothetical protein